MTINTNRNIVVEFTDERIIPAGGLAMVGALLGKCDFIKNANRMDVTPNRSRHQIKNGDILLTYIGMLCMGKPYFEGLMVMLTSRIQVKYYLCVEIHGEICYKKDTYFLRS